MPSGMNSIGNVVNASPESQSSASKIKAGIASDCLETYDWPFFADSGDIVATVSETEYVRLRLKFLLFTEVT